MIKYLSDHKCCQVSIFSLEEVINHCLNEAFKKPLMANLIRMITDLSSLTQQSLKRSSLIREKCKEMKGIIFINESMIACKTLCILVQDIDSNYDIMISTT